MHKKVVPNQLQLENVLAVVFAEIQITACIIHYKVAGALIRKRQLIASYAVIICLFLGDEVVGHKREKEACSVATFEKRDE